MRPQKVELILPKQLSLCFIKVFAVKVSITSQLSKIDSKVWFYVFPILANEVANLLEKTTDKRLICTLANGYSWSCALLSDGKGDYFINVNKHVRKAAEIEPDQVVTFTLEPDQSEYGMPVPEELIELWAMDESYMDVFHKLTPGKQRSLLYRIGEAKSSNTRAKRAVQFMEYLKSTNGVLDYKELNVFVKNWNSGL